MASPGPPPDLWQWAALLPSAVAVVALLRKGLVRRSELPAAPFTVGDLLMALFLFLGVSVLLDRALDIPFLPEAWVAGLILVVADSTGGSVVLLAARAADPSGAALGLRGLPRLRNGLVVVLVLAAFLIPCHIVTWAWMKLLEVAGHPPVSQRAVELYVEAWIRGDLWGVAAITLGALLAAPLFEELFFRGLLFGILRRPLGDWRAIAISSLAFALFHFQPEVLVPIFLVGLVLNVVYVRTGDLASAVLFHLGFNGTTLASMFLELHGGGAGR